MGRDRERSKSEYAEDIVSGLKWLGIDIDYSDPYKQSEHSDTYQKYIETMLKNGTAYISKEEVKEEGQRAEVIRLKNPNKKVKYEDVLLCFMFFILLEEKSKKNRRLEKIILKINYK